MYIVKVPAKCPLGQEEVCVIISVHRFIWVCFPSRSIRLSENLIKSISSVWKSVYPSTCLSYLSICGTTLPASSLCVMYLCVFCVCVNCPDEYVMCERACKHMLRGCLHVKRPKIIQGYKDSPSVCVQVCHKYRFIKIFWGAQCCGKCKQVGRRDKYVLFCMCVSGWLVSLHRAHVSSWHLFAPKLFWVATVPLGSLLATKAVNRHRNVENPVPLLSEDNYLPLFSLLFPLIDFIHFSPFL